jgi:N-hydroxyarylamine O-acetyltransferase
MDVDAIAARMGLEFPVSQDIQGLRRLFAAWCSAVSFDNLLKTRALFNDPDGVLPGLDPEAFFSHWLAHGTGGTCWTQANALHAFAAALGFDARRASGSMFDFGNPNHGTVIVALPDGTHWLLDNVFLNYQPLRLDSEEPFVVRGRVHFAEVEHADGSVFVHGTMPPIPAIFFRLLDWNVTEDAFAAGYEASRGKSAFNDRAHVMRCYRDRIVVLRGRFLYALDEAGMTKQELGEQGLRSHLASTMGISSEYIELWAASGALSGSIGRDESSFETIPRRTPPSRKVQARA